MQVGQWVRERIAGHKLSVKRVSDLAGVSRQTVYSVINDEYPPSVETQLGLSIALDVLPDWYDRLMRGEAPVERSTMGGVAASMTATAYDPRFKKLENEIAHLRASVVELGRVLREELGFEVAVLQGDEESPAMPDEPEAGAVAPPTS